MAKEILNAKITGTKLGEEHGCLTAQIFLEGEHWGCAFGGYCLDHWFADTGEHSSTDGYGAIIELMKTLEVESWEKLKGQYVRAEFDSNGWGSPVLRIGHIMKDQWFSWKEYFDTAKNKHKNKEND